MILGEVFPGEDAEVLVEAVHVDENGNPTGEDEDTIQNFAVYVKHYKETEQPVTGATHVWNSNMGQYLITIPEAYIPPSGIFDVCVKGSDIWDILIRLQVNTGDSKLTNVNSLVTSILQGITDIKGSNWVNETLVTIQAAAETGGSTTGGGSGHIITDYSFNPDENTITITEEGYTTIKAEQIISIFNLTTGSPYFNSEARKYGEQPGKPWNKYYPLASVADGVITYTAPDLNATSEDKLQIIVNIT